MAGRKSAKNKIEKDQQNAVAQPIVGQVGEKKQTVVLAQSSAPKEQSPGVPQDQAKDKKGPVEIGVAK